MRTLHCIEPARNPDRLEIRLTRLPSAAALLSALITLAATPGAVAQGDPLAKAAAEPGAAVKPSGLVFKSIKDGSGAQPEATDTVRVHYRGTFPDGREFDSSYKRGQPASFPLNRVIKCWTEGLQLMKPGGKAKLTCPAAIAYGDKGAGGGEIPPGAVLQFEVELLSVQPGK
jgi:FKBP-type peptidyl-prolyl cis-trans isomerase FkpA